MRGSVVSVRLKQANGRMVGAEQLVLVAGKGIEGDLHFGTPDRQVLFLDEASLEEFGYAPGDLRDQILVDFPGLQGLAVGTIVSVGDARVEITMDCAPCLHMAASLGEEGQSFVTKMIGKRGMLGKVVSSGVVTPGDAVLVEVPAGA